MSTDGSIHDRIADLVQREHALREQLASGDISRGEEHEQLQTLETALDQCWDLLRQRDALRAVGRDPDAATVRPVDQVEGYQN
jgi:hypothetical protein